MNSLSAVTIFGFVVFLVNGTLAATIANTTGGGEDNLHRIVGGQAAAQSQFPFTVAMLFNGRLLCGGALITPSHVLTAAHCTNALGQSASQVSIRVGSIYGGSAGQSSQVARIIQHPLYSTSSQNNDISILVLDTPVTLSNSVNVATITRREPSGGETVTVSGWGLLKEQGTNPSSLQYVDLPIVGRLQCRAVYGTRTVTDNMICAGTASGGRDSCQGDSGGPLVRQGTNDLVGIVSWGVGCGRPGRPGVYTNLARYSRWISEQTQGGSGASGLIGGPCDRLSQICNRTALQILCNIVQNICNAG